MPAVPPAEVVVDARLVRRLVRAQHPDLADRPVRRLGTGWDNEVFRLGPDLVVRVPRRTLGADLIGTELDWLPHLSPGLPLPTPEPVRRGVPTDDYPFPWAISRYVPGRPVGAEALSGPAGVRAAAVLAGFLRALHVPAPAGAPHNPYRGVPLADRTEAFARALTDALPAVAAGWAGAARAAWAEVVQVPGHAGGRRWLHGDLHGLNVLAARGRLSGVIDFGDLCGGDPATDLACAWLLLDGPGRGELRDRMGISDQEWERGRGWALYLAVMFLAHGAQAPTNAAIGRRGLREVLARR